MTYHKDSDNNYSSHNPPYVRLQKDNLRRKLWQQRVLPQRRAALIAKMGGACALCGARADLQFDHYPEPSPIVLRLLSSRARLKHYAAAWAAGKLRLLCSACNHSLGGSGVPDPAYQIPRGEEIPI